jgi:hypothetical protein
MASPEHTFTAPCAGSVDFLTITCYQLHRPATFPLTGEARRYLGRWSEAWSSTTDR